MDIEMPPLSFHLPRADGQMGKRANGQTGKRAKGQEGKRAKGQKGKRVKKANKQVHKCSKWVNMDSVIISFRRDLNV